MNIDCYCQPYQGWNRIAPHNSIQETSYPCLRTTHRNSWNASMN